MAYEYYNESVFMCSAIKSDGTDSLISIKVVPGSSKTKIAGMLGDSVKVNVAAAPEKGKANKELIKFLAKTLDIPKSGITIVSGEKDQRKTLKLADLSVESVLEKISVFL